jgi:CheY-like chemotaxis protein
LANIPMVEDDVAVQGEGRFLLERDGHDVRVASDGLRTFETGDFDLLIVDIFMPGMDGQETRRLVHQQRPDIPIIVISGRPISQDASGGPDCLDLAIKLGAINSPPEAIQGSYPPHDGYEMPRSLQNQIGFLGQNSRRRRFWIMHDAKNPIVEAATRSGLVRKLERR